MPVLNLRFERTPILPFLRLKVLEVPASDVSLSRRIYKSGAALTNRLNVEQRHRREKMKKLDQTRVLTRPFRHMFSVLRTPIQHLQQSLSTERFIHAKVAGMNGTMKLDPLGWAHDEGRTLDRLIRP